MILKTHFLHTLYTTTVMKLKDKHFYLFEIIGCITILGTFPIIYTFLAYGNLIAAYKVSVYVILIHIIAGAATWRTCHTDNWIDLLMWQFVYIFVLTTIILIILNLLIRDGLFLSVSLLCGVFLYMGLSIFSILHCGIYALIKRRIWLFIQKLRKFKNEKSRIV